MLRAWLPLALLAVATALLAGCGGAATSGAAPPESASLAPADALLYATVTTDEGSDQWQKGEALLEKIPGAREGLADAVSSALTEEGLTWEADVAPALGPEVVVVVTADKRPVVLTRPDDEAKLDALLAKGDEPTVRGEVEGWVAIAEQQADLDAYRAALGRGTLLDHEAFTDGFEVLPEEGIARLWVDAAGLSEDLGKLADEVSTEIDLGLDWVSAAVSADDDGALVTMGLRTPGGGDTSYDPELFDGVPDDAVAALSFGGTQSTLDRLQGSVDVDDLTRKVEEATGVSLEGILDAFSGEGVLYVRPGDPVPDVTLALDPPDADETWETVNRLAQKLAGEAGAEIRTRTEDGVEVRYVVVEDITVSWARLDDDTVIVTTNSDAVRLFTADGGKLSESERFRQAAEEVGLEGRTRGFVYVDFDALLTLVQRLGGDDGLPPDAEEAFRSLDTVILQASGDGDTTRVSGFVRLSD